MNKRGNVVVYIILAFIAVLLFFLLAGFIATEASGLVTTIDHTSSETFIATRTNNETLSPIGEGITSTTVTRQNDTWLELDGGLDYLFIPDNNFVSVSFWVNNSANNWIHVVNSSTIVYEDKIPVGSLTLNPFKKNATGWYFGINETGYFGGNIDSIKFFNDTVSATQVSDIYDEGRK